MTDRPNWTRGLIAMGACPEAVKWARGYPSLKAAWRACTRGDWMWWLLRQRPDGLDRRKLVRCAWLAAVRVQPADPDERVTGCLLLLHLWLDGEDVPDAELRTAVYAAYYAAYTAYADTDAVYAAAAAAVYAAAAYAAVYTAYTAERTKQARDLRREWPSCPITLEAPDVA